MTSTSTMSFPSSSLERPRLALPKTVIVEPSLTVGLEEVHAAQRTPSPLPPGQRRSPRFSPRRPSFDKTVENSANHTSTPCMKIMVLEDAEGTIEPSGEDKEQAQYGRQSPQNCQPSKNDVLSVVIEKLTELVESSEREQKRKAAASDSESSSGTSTPRGQLFKRRSRSPARSSRSKLYKCPNCPCLFAVTKKQLRRKNAPICQCCEKAKNAEKFQAQVQAAEQFGLVSCEVCPYKATNYQSLLQHLATHPKTEIYKCVLCDYVTTTQTSILNHQNAHTRPNSRKYQCSSCGYSTTEFNNLQTHLQVHNKQGELVLKCSECGFSCRCEDSLRNHMWKHVSSENQDAGSSDISSSKSPTRSSENDKSQMYKCLLCGYICEKLCTLKAHAWRHAGEKECSYPVINEGKTEKTSLTESVSRIAVGCCGDSNSVCCMGGSKDKPQCQCPAINIPATSLSTLQKLAGNTGSKKKSKGLHYDRENLQIQGKSGLPSQVIQRLLHGINESSGHDVADVTNESTKISTAVDHRVAPMDIPPDVVGEVEVTTTEGSPIKGSMCAEVALRTQSDCSRKRHFQQSSVIFELQDDSVGMPSGYEELASKRLKQELPLEGVDSSSHLEDGEAVSDFQKKNTSERSEQPSDAMRALSSIDGGISKQIDSPDVEASQKRKRDDKASDEDASCKQPCTSKVFPIKVARIDSPTEILKSSVVENEINKEPYSNNPNEHIYSAIHSNETPSSKKISQNVSILQEKYVATNQCDPKTSLPSSVLGSRQFSIQGQEVTTQNQGQEVMTQSSVVASDSRDASDSAQISDNDLKQQQRISESLLNVIEKFVAETDSRTGSSFYCPMCGYKVDTSQNLKEHIHTCHVKGPKKCPKCPAIFYLKSKFDTHMEQKHPLKRKGDARKSDAQSEEICENCQRVFIGINAMATHKRSCLPNSLHKIAESDDSSDESEAFFDKWECEKCPESFDDKNDWLKHLEVHDVDGKVQKQDPDNKKCTICSREFVGSFALTIHQRSCIRKRWYGCRDCDYSGPTPEDLAHHAVIHKKPYQCEQCAYTSASISGIRNHMKFHSTDKPYKCHLCEFRGAYPQSLRSHMKAHQTYTPNQLETVDQFKCKLCGYICNHLPSLKSHMWKHASDPKYNYDTVNDAINTVMDALTTQTLKVPDITDSTTEGDKPVIASVLPSNITGSKASKTPSPEDETPSAPQLIMINTSSTTRPKMVMVREHLSSKEHGDQQNKSVGFEYGVMVLKCSECEFQTVSKDRMLAHVSVHFKEQTK